MLTLTMLPARMGDCLWIEYPDDAGRVRHLVIDGGPEKAGVLEAEVARRMAGGAALHIELLVVTHIDNDHIGGVLELLEAPPEGLTIGDIWFNGLDQVNAAVAARDRLGTDQADRLSAVMARRGPPWNAAFGPGAPPICVPDAGALPVKQLAGGLALTLLGPSLAALAALLKEWKTVRSGETEVADAGPADRLGRHDVWPPTDLRKLADEPFSADPGRPNASSIALLLEWRGRRILLAADATARQLCEAIGRLPVATMPDGRLALDAFKVAHHGSKRNTNRALLDLVRCARWLVSTDGSTFAHPDAAAMARLIVHGGPDPELVFNSRAPYPWRWADARVPATPRFRTFFPDAEGEAVTLDLPADGGAPRVRSVKPAS